MGYITTEDLGDFVKGVEALATIRREDHKGGDPMPDPTPTDRDRDMAYQYLADAEGLPEEEEAGHLALFLTQARREGMRQATQEIWRLIQKEADARPAFFGCYPYAPLITKFEERYGHLLDITSEGNGI